MRRFGFSMSEFTTLEEIDYTLDALYNIVPMLKKIYQTLESYIKRKRSERNQKMRFHTFLLKYGEIGIKGKNKLSVRRCTGAPGALCIKKDVDGQFDVHKSQARIYVDCEGDYDYEDTVEHLKRVFGLVGICPVVRMEDKGFEELKKDVVAYMDEMYPDKNFTFKVESRRAKKSYPLNSMEISRDLGEAILYAFPESGIKKLMCIIRMSWSM